MGRLMNGLNVMRGINHATKVRKNQGAMKIDHRKFTSCEAKGIAVCYHYIFHALRERVIELRDCAAEYMLDDNTTKAVRHVTWEPLVKSIGLLQHQLIARQ